MRLISRTISPLHPADEPHRFAFGKEAMGGAWENPLPATRRRSHSLFSPPRSPAVSLSLYLFLYLAPWFFVLTLPTSSQWREIPLPYPDSTRFKVQFVDEMHGWVSNATGAILQTTDGGGTWREHRFTGTTHLNDIHFVDTHHGWLYARGRDLSPGKDTLFRTSDGGENWAQRPFPDSTQVTGRPLHGYINEPYNIEYIDSDKVFFEGFRKYIIWPYSYIIQSWYSTTNGGSRWDSLAIPVHWPYAKDVMFLRNMQNWIRIDYDPGLPDIPVSVNCYLSSDLGNTWTPSTSWFDVLGRSFFKCDSLHYVIFNDSYRELYGSPPGTFVTTDGGSTWTVFPYFNIAKMGVMPQDTVLWVIDLGYSTSSNSQYHETKEGYIIRIHFSTNGLQAYHAMSPYKAVWLCNVGRKVFALTSLGRLIVFDDLEVSVYPEEGARGASKLLIHSIHPNPCNSGYLALEYENGANEHTTISVYSATGLKMLESVPPDASPNGHCLLFLNVTVLPEGVYFILLKSHLRTTSGHFIIYR